MLVQYLLIELLLLVVLVVEEMEKLIQQEALEILLQQLQLKVKMVDQVITLQDQQKQEAVVAQELLVKMEQEVQHHQVQVLMV